jgi:[acyl-carrier-protein] S-malonyltransferase
MSLALVFSPQGSQVVGMGRELAEVSDAARAVYDRADAALGWPVSSVCFDGPEEILNDTRQTQPCLLATSVACLRALEERLGTITPAFVAGHSVGEYAALVAAAVLSLEDALRIVARRAQLMAEVNVEGGMAAALGLDREQVATVIATVGSPVEVVVANDNAPGQVVISGTETALAAATEALRVAGARRVVRLRVSGPFHSPHLADVADALAESLDAATWHEPTVPVVSNVTASPERDAAKLRNLLAEQVRSPVEWVASVRRMVDEGIDTFVECGPGAALTGMISRIAPQARTLNVSNLATLAGAVETLVQAPTPASVQA